MSRRGRMADIGTDFVVGAGEFGIDLLSMGRNCARVGAITTHDWVKIAEGKSAVVDMKIEASTLEAHFDARQRLEAIQAKWDAAYPSGK